MRALVVGHDVTERKRAEQERERLLAEEEALAAELQSQSEELRVLNEELRVAQAESASLLALVVGSSDDAIVAETLDGVITSWNEAAEAIYGYSAAEIVGRPLSVLACPEKPQEMEGILGRIGKGERIDHLETTWMTKDGGRIEVSLTVSPVYDVRGKLVSSSLISRDMTQRKRAEIALLESQRLLSSIINGTSDMIWSVDPQSFGLLSFNHGLRDHFLRWRGLSIEVGMGPEDLYSVDDFVQEWRGLYGRALSTGPYTTEYRVYAGTHVLELSFNPLEREGQVFGISVFGRDVTAQKKAEKERLLAQEKEMAAAAYARGLIEASLDALVTISPEGKITDVNEATIKITGRAREELIGTDFSDYFTDPESARRGYQEVFAKGSVTDYPLTIRDQNGKLTDVLYNASVYRDHQGKVLGVFAAARDITALKELEVQRNIASKLQETLLDIPEQIGWSRVRPPLSLRHPGSLGRAATSTTSSGSRTTVSPSSSGTSPAMGWRQPGSRPWSKTSSMPSLISSAVPASSSRRRTSFSSRSRFPGSSRCSWGSSTLRADFSSTPPPVTPTPCCVKRRGGGALGGRLVSARRVHEAVLEGERGAAREG